MVGVVPSRFDREGFVVVVEDSNDSCDFLGSGRVELAGGLECTAGGGPVVCLFG